MATTGSAAEAADLARRADEVAAKLKAGTWDSVQALALLSIAKSLSAMASSSDR
jgi:hypothetical protein